ncbi:hypothetical protein EVJ50_02495 [Synechococcus sp. RSCCF101]|uniref:bestrophin family ion channel n=1 Tax=Synechococcus sp. RSCCF101 TaxID=2511069 RepID=UPI00124767EC|nr:bestrophin family ion channel [Synechococcus sp. RSCCF101]QEY31282.1 hypothetical protein EVJ50_02495 [Synechococcus sp. RSCCF101]
MTRADPPRTGRRDYALVLWQLLWRMRLDLLLFALLYGAVAVSGSTLQSLYLTGTGLSVLGIAVSIFIAFRNTQAIGRWWEARQLWGAMVNSSRQWRDTLTAHIPRNRRDGPRLRQLLQLQVIQVWLLNFELRNFWRPELRQAVDQHLDALLLKRSLSLQQLCRLRAEAIGELHDDGWIDAFGRQQLVGVANASLEAIGGLQRIRNTPIPASYDVFVRLITWVYGLELLLEFHRGASQLIGGVLCLGFLVAERIGSYVEGPFDRDGSSFSLPLNTICDTVTADLLDHPLLPGGLPSGSDPVRWD